MTTATIMDLGFGTYVPQIIEKHEVINLQSESSYQAAFAALKLCVRDAVLVSATTWQQAKAQAKQDLTKSLVPVEVTDTFGKDAFLFLKNGDGSFRKMLVTRVTKNLFYVVPLDCIDGTPWRLSKGTLYKKVVEV